MPQFPHSKEFGSRFRYEGESLESAWSDLGFVKPLWLLCAGRIVLGAKAAWGAGSWKIMQYLSKKDNEDLR